MNEQEYIPLHQGDRSMPTPDPQVAPVMPGPGIAVAAVQETGKSPVPGNSSDTPQESTAEIKSAADLVRLLRKSGLSKAAAKAVASGGWKGLQALSPERSQENERRALVDALQAVRAKLEEN